MKVHEYQAKEIFAQYGVPILPGKIISQEENAEAAAKEIGGNIWAVKAQVHAGGRGKAGGVKIAKNIEEVKKFASEILGMRLITHQTGDAGKIVKKVYIEDGVAIQTEFYLGIVLDRTLEKPVMITSTEGGVEIEKVAEKNPEKIIKIAIDPLIGFQNFHARKLAFGLKLTKEQQREFFKFVSTLYKVYLETDASLIEINPLVLTQENNFIALDAKINFDDNALFRHPEIIKLRDLDEEEPSEIEAKKFNLSYVKLDGNVGCMVNGAGLAMSTMDIIKYYQGEPANFLDVGGNASAETVAKGFDIILRDPNVKAIFINIFGGIVRCDRIANGILEATKKNEVTVPLIVRLDGTNSEKAAQILQNAKIKNIIYASNLADGAQKAVIAAKGGQK